MPIYEYECLDCRARFDAMRSMADANQAIACKKCQGRNTVRKLSVFFASSQGRAVASSTGGGCAGCVGGSCGSCGSCGHAH